MAKIKNKTVTFAKLRVVKYFDDETIKLALVEHVDPGLAPCPILS